MLEELFKMRQEVPEIFYKALSEDLHLSLEDILRFNVAMRVFYR